MDKRINIIERGREWEKQDAKSVINLQEIAHPVDKTLISALEAARVKDILNPAMEQLVSANYGQLLATGIPLDEKSFPDMYYLMEDTCQRLRIKIPYTVISNELNGINAFATGTDQKSFVVISNMTPSFLKSKELQFILAHECGHIAMKHMVYHTAGSLAAVVGSYIPILGPALTKTVVFPLNCWNRCSEITADRIGLVCCEDINAAQHALLKIVGGYTNVDGVDIDHYIAKCRALQGTQLLGKVGEYFQTHPMVYKRLKALEFFYNSESYYHATQKLPPNGVRLMSKDELDNKTRELLRVL